MMVTCGSRQETQLKAYKLHMECHRKFEFEFHQKLVHTLDGAVDQDWRSKMHAPKHAS